MTTIAEDMFNFILAILHPKMGVQDHVVTNGNAAQTIPLLKTYDRICPAITIVNTSGGTVTVGFGGNPTFPLVVGASITLRYRNPCKSGLCVQDNGTATTLDIIGG